MTRETTQFEQRYAAKANTIGLLFLAAHVPVLCGLAAYMDTGIALTLGIGVFLLLGPAVLMGFGRESAAVSIALGIAAMGFSALAIHVSGGMIEAHFHIFTMIALLIVFGRVWPILAAAGTIALHHILFWLWLPASVFNYKASFGMVILHALFVVFEVIPACWIAAQFGKNCWASGIVDEKLDAAAEQIGAASNQLRTAGEGLAQTACQQAATCEETAACSAEIKSSAHRSQVLSEEALQLMATVNRQMSSANIQMEAVKSKVSSMADSSGQIGKVIKLIDEIAFLTNILSLNASIEAARAGEFGLGFAVVANEVRGLALRSATAATDSALLIERAAEESKAGQQSIAQLLAAMDEVTKTAQIAQSHMEQIQGVSVQQSRSVEMIDTALGSLDQMSQSTAANAEEAGASSTELNVQTLALREIVSILKHI